MISSLTRAYERYTKQSGHWIERFVQQGGRVHCQAGCANCCSFPIRVSLAEALFTASHLTDTQLQAMNVHAARVMQNARTATSWDLYFQRHRTDIGFCPLLDQTTGSCTAYQARPGRCRDTYSAYDAHYCKVGTLEQMNRQESQAFQREIKTNPATDGTSHYIAPLEDMGEDIWQVASQSMQETWGLEIWGDFWVLTSLSTNEIFMNAVRAGNAKQAIKQAKKLGLWHIEIVQIGTA